MNFTNNASQHLIFDHLIYQFIINFNLKYIHFTPFHHQVELIVIIFKVLKFYQFITNLDQYFSLKFNIKIHFIKYFHYYHYFIFYRT